MLDNKVIVYQCQDKRNNSPSVGMVTMETDNIEGKQTWQYDPHIAPTLQLNNSRSAVERLIDYALAGTRSAEALRME